MSEAEIPRKLNCHFCPAEFYYGRAMSGHAAKLQAHQAGWVLVFLDDYAGAPVWTCPDVKRHEWWAQKVAEWNARERDGGKR